MPPKLALIGCIIFIAYLFHHERKRVPRFSPAMWLPYLWLLIQCSRPVSDWFGARDIALSPETYLEGNPTDRMIFLGLILAGIAALFKRNIQLSKVVSSNAWLIAFLLYCGISVLWSDYTFVAFKRWIKEIGNLTMVLIVMTDERPVEAIKALLRRIGYLVVPMSIVLIKYFPEAGRTFTRSGETMNIGVTMHKNQLGILCAVLCIAYILNVMVSRRAALTPYYRKERRNIIILIIMMLWLMQVAQSATSIMCGVIGVAILYGLEYRVVKRNVKNIGIYITAMILLMIVLEYAVDIKQIILSALGRDVTLTGRTIVWQQVLSVGTNPIIGTGYESYWLGDRMKQFWDQYWWQPNQAHNGYLEVYLNLGYIGLFFLAGILVSVYRNIAHRIADDYDVQRFRLAIFVLVLLSNVTEAYFKGLSMVWFFFLLVAVRYPVLLQNNRLPIKPHQGTLDSSWITYPVARPAR